MTKLIDTTIDTGSTFCNAVSLTETELEERKERLKADALKFLAQADDSISHLVYYHDTRDSKGNIIHATLHYNIVGLTAQQFEERSKNVTGEIGEVHRVNKTYVKWSQVQEFVASVCRKYEDANLKGVYGLPRGGLVFAVMISHKLCIPMLAAPCEGCLIVDDICDSGESLIHYKNNTSGKIEFDYHIATMYYKKNELGVIPECYFDTKDDKWIVFPWEGDWVSI